MYTSFHIKNFRGFNDLELKNLERINLIAGRNNVGKTALLEALMIYNGNYDASLILRTQAQEYDSRMPIFRQSSRRRTPSIPNWIILFHNFDRFAEISLSGVAEYVPLQLPLFNGSEADQSLEISLLTINDVPDNARILRRIVSDSLDFEAFRDVDVLRLSSSQGRVSYLAQYRGGLITDIRLNLKFPTTFLSARQSVPLEEDAINFTSLKRKREDHQLLSTLKIIEPRLESLELLYDGEPPIISGYIKNLDQPLPISSMGDGFQRVASLILAIGTTENGIVFIDEIENGLHHSVLPDVWKAIASAASEFNVQIFATTHSLEMIRAAHEAFKDDDPYEFRLHRLDRSKKTGDIQAITYDRDGMEAAVDLNAEVR